MEELCKLLAEHPSLAFVSDAQKVKCSLSGHEMPAKVKDVLAYVNGHKYHRLRASVEYDYSSVEPCIIQSKRRRQQLYCRLTGRYINKLPDHVERHRKGKRFTSALKKYKKGELLLADEQHKRQGERNTRDQYGQINSAGRGGGGVGEKVGGGGAENSDDEWREGVEMDDGEWVPSDKEGDEWDEEGTVDDKGEDSDSHGDGHGDKDSDKQAEEEEEDCDTLGSSGERNSDKSSQEEKGIVQVAKATAKRKRGRKGFSRNFISSREKMLNF